MKSDMNERLHSERERKGKEKVVATNSLIVAMGRKNGGPSMDPARGVQGMHGRGI